MKNALLGLGLVGTLLIYTTVESDDSMGVSTDSTANFRAAMIELAASFTGFDTVAIGHGQLVPTVVRLVPASDSALAFVGGLSPLDDVVEIQYDPLNWSSAKDSAITWSGRLWLQRETGTFLAARLEKNIDGRVMPPVDQWISGAEALWHSHYAFDGWLDTSTEVKLLYALRHFAVQQRRSAIAVFAWLAMLSRHDADPKPYWCILDIGVRVVPTAPRDTSIRTNYLHIYDATTGKLVQISSVVP
jgi:hypothetical protein